MENLITVISLQGQAWAVAQDGTRRELKVGDTVAADEMVITVDGAQIDLQFANNNQVLTLIGEQEAPVDVVQIAQDVQLSQPLTPISEQQQSPSMRAGDDAIEKEGHRFVQLVRIGEIIEADGFTPLTVARIQEIIKPLGMALPERDFEQDRWKDNVSRNEHGSVDLTPPVLLIDQLAPLENADADEIFIDFSSKFNDAVSGSDISYEAENLPDGLTMDPNTGIVSGKIASSASQGGNTGNKGEYKVTITVTDPSGNSSDHEFIWTVTNPGPAANDDKGVTDEDTPLVVGAQDGVLKNDNDPDGDQLYVTGIVAGEDKPTTPGGLNKEIIGKYGSLTLQEDGSYVYTPDKNNPEVRSLKDGQTLEDTFSYTMTDREGGEDDAVLRITINGVTDGEPTITPVDGNDSLGGIATEGHVTVYESGLTDDGPADGSKEVKGTITVEAKDGLVSIAVGAEALDLDALTNLSDATPVTITTPYGVLTLTGFTPDIVNGITVGGELSYSYELTKRFDNAEPGQTGDENGLDKIDLKVVDAGNAHSTGTLEINIIDDVPTANDDVNSIEENTASVMGNVMSNDREGADGAEVSAIVSGNVAANAATINADGDLVIQGEYGQLTIKADGSYTYELDNANPAVNALKTGQALTENFTYTLTDTDLDADTAQLVITIHGVTDGDPTIVPEDHNNPEDPADPLTAGHATVYESGLVAGGPAGQSKTVAGEITVDAQDGLVSVTVGSETLDLDALAALSSTTPAPITTAYGVLTLTGFTPTVINGITVGGQLSYSYELTTRFNNAEPGQAGDENGLDKIDLKVVDAGNAHSTGILEINIIDDVPQIDSTTHEPILEVDETTLGVAGQATVDFAGIFTPIYGADGKGVADEYTLLASNGSDSGLVDTATGNSVLLYQTADGIEGRTGGEAGNVAFKLSVDADGKVTLTQNSAVKHPVTTDPDDKVTLKDSGIKLQLKITDADGDTATKSVDIGKFIGFKDDGPMVTEILDDLGFVVGNEIVDEKYLPTGSASDAAKLTVTKELPIDFGADGAVNANGKTGLVFAKTDALTALNLKSGTKPLSYEISTDGHTITAKADGNDIFTIELKVAANGTPSYKFTLQGPLDHTLKTDDDKEYAENIVLPFDITAIDGDGDSVDLKFKVEVKDDTPPSDTRELDVNEDGFVSFSNADVNQTTTTVATAPDHGTVIIGNDGTITYVPNEDYRGSDSYTYKVITDGGEYERTVNITVKPVADAPLFADRADGGVVVTPEDTEKSLGLKLPEIKDKGADDQKDAGYSGTDYSELLGAITLTPTGAGYVDDAKLQTGAIELKPAADGKITIVITDQADFHVSNIQTLYPEDTANGVYHLTTAEYEAITAHPAEDRHENFKVEVSVKSYEVDGTGEALDDALVGGTNGVESTQTITVDVHAVTDRVALKVQADNTQTDVEVVISGDAKTADITFDEDTSFNLTNILAPGVFKDLDGSETRYLGFKDLPNGTTVTVVGVHYVIGQASTPTVDFGGTIGEIPALTLAGKVTDLPQITITPPKDLSGDLPDFEVILGARDSDSDSPDADPTLMTDEVVIKLHVKPVAGDVAIEGAEGDEDTAIKFLENIKVTDYSTATGTLGEVITEVSFTVPSGPTGWTIDAVNNTWSNAEGQTWTMTEPAASADWSGAWVGNTYTITFDTSPTGIIKEARESILKEFTVTPPAHSSKDIDLSVEVTSVDHSIISGGLSSAPASKTETLKVVVKPVAEVIGDGPVSDTDGNSQPDLTMGDDHVYQTTGEEDKWFDLGTEGGFKLSAGWSNEDGKWVFEGGAWKDVSSSGENTDDSGRSEDTFALLTPFKTVGNSAEAGAATDGMLEGSVFTYVGPDGLVTLPFAGEPVKIPMQYLDTVEFKGPQDWSGVVKVRVQAGTVDYDEDDNAATKLEVSGESWLTNLIIGPKADQVTLKVDAIIKTDEDKPVELNINPTSSDPSETFDVTIKGIPKGAKITYDVTEYDTLADSLPAELTEETDGTFTLKIENFDTSKQPTLTPPKDSNVTIELEVTAQSVDTLTYIDKDGNTVTVTDADPSKSHTLNTEVQVQGVPDEPILELVPNKVYIEDGGDQDSGQLKVTLSDLITELKSGETGVANAGPDGSETVTLRISGLPDGFGLENAGPALGGSGESRVWVITKADLASVQIVVPQHYSGTVNFTAQPVVTENDNPSEIFFSPQNVEFQITPVPEATLSISSNLVEDTIGELELMPVGDDSDEYISAVRIAEDAVTTAGVTLYDANNNPLTASGGYYTVTNTGTTGAPVVKVKGSANFSGEKTLKIEYQVTDPMTSDTSTTVTSGWQTQEHTLNFAPITDEIELSLGDISGATTAGGITTAEKDSTVTVGLKITQKPDADANNQADADGSEKFTHVFVSGVPAGVSVNGAIETATGEWLITVGELPFNTAELTHSLEFVVSGYADTFEKAITITTYTQDTGAATIEKDSIEWTLKYVSDTGADPVDLPELELTAIDTSQIEDVSFVLGSVVTGAVSGGSTSAPFDLTVTIRTTPDDETTYSGMTRTLVTEGDQQVALWTATVTGATKDDAQGKLEDLLNSITVTPPQDANSNNIAGGTLDLDVNVSAHAHGVSRGAQATVKLPITPVTDNVIVSVSENVVGEGETIELNISLSSENGADGALGANGAGWTVVGDTVFIHIADGLEGALYVNGVMNSGSATAPAGAPTGLTGGKYYQVTVADLDKLEFRPDAGSPHQTGSLGVTVWVEHQENNDAGSKVSTGEGSLTIEQSNSGYEATIIAEGPEVEVSGDKAKAIELVFDGPGLVDSGESVSTAYISGLPSGFTVYMGTDADSSTMANNAGENTWAIPVTGGALPAYIAILPPANWSGSLTGVNLTVLSGHAGLTPTPTELPIAFEVTPVASGITLNPTLSFGDAGELIALNLNASMKDPVAATGATGDAHTERTELKLTGFTGGEKVQFFIGTEEGDGTLSGRVVHDGSGNYTISGLTQAELDSLKFVHGTTDGPKPIGISARTYEVDTEGVQVGDFSDPATGTMNINISPVVATSGADKFLWEGKAINGFGGEDTVQLRFGDDLGSSDFANLKNIEIIDMSGAASGANSITGLSVEDVFNMTEAGDEGHILKILGDAEDSVALTGDWGTGTVVGDNTVYTAFHNEQVVKLEVNTIID